jgi:hypothetical protein
MSYVLQDDDYFALWKYFEDRAGEVKEAMFRTVNLSEGFSRAMSLETMEN